MGAATWSLQDAKNRFIAVVAAAERGEPQVVTKRGRSAVVVLSIDDYERLRAAEGHSKPSFVEHLLSASKRPSSISDDEELFPRLDFSLRDAEL